MTSVITVENLSKAYRIGLVKQIPDTLATAVAGWVRSPLRNIRRLTQLNTFEAEADDPGLHWALRNISFEVSEGDVVGIIGANGAGKSTLLKVLSRITIPTSGRVRIKGKVSSLLEVGTGFHPELTGRENVYMNGTILGMRKHEIDKKFDEIVDFSGVEKFLDTPIKRYSSGMKVRLAFAVAAHLEPDILVIDEVLAVGDHEFQSKCLAKMNDVATSGRTVLFVSHNMAAVQNLCSRAIFLHKGEAVADGEVGAVISDYLGRQFLAARYDSDLSQFRVKGMRPVIRSVSSTADDDVGAISVKAGEGLRISMSYELPAPARVTAFAVQVESQNGQPLFYLNTDQQAGGLRSIPMKGEVQCLLPELHLLPGTYYLTVYCSVDGTRIDHLQRTKALQVQQGDVFGTGRLPSPRRGAFYQRCEWSVTKNQKNA